MNKFYTAALMAVVVVRIIDLIDDSIYTRKMKSIKAAAERAGEE